MPTRETISPSLYATLTEVRLQLLAMFHQQRAQVAEQHSLLCVLFIKRRPRRVPIDVSHHSGELRPILHQRSERRRFGWFRADMKLVRPKRARLDPLPFLRVQWHGEMILILLIRFATCIQDPIRFVPRFEKCFKCCAAKACHEISHC